MLAARREEPLEEAARECGANAVAVPTDVTDEAAVQRLAQAAVERFGGVDVWVNNAGVYAVGRFEDTPSEAFERVHQTNFLGSVYGARTALERPRRETTVGTAGKLLAWQRRLAPSLAHRVFAKQIEVDHFGEGSASPSDGNLFKPMAEGTATTGGWNTVPTGVRRAGLAAGAALAAAVGAGLLLRRG